MFERDKMIREGSLPWVLFSFFSVRKNNDVLLYIFSFLLYKFVSNPNFNKVLQTVQWFLLMNMCFSCLDLLFSENQQLAPLFHLSNDGFIFLSLLFFFNHCCISQICLGPLPSLDWMISQDARSLRSFLAGAVGCTAVLSHRKILYWFFLAQEVFCSFYFFIFFWFVFVLFFLLFFWSLLRPVEFPSTVPQRPSSFLFLMTQSTSFVSGLGWGGGEGNTCGFSCVMPLQSFLQGEKQLECSEYQGPWKKNFNQVQAQLLQQEGVWYFPFSFMF